MAKKKKEEETAPEYSGVGSTGSNGQDIEITKAIVKDDICIYSYRVLNGVVKGQEHKSVKGPGIVDEDMKLQLSKLNVHLAIIDDSFKLSGVEVDKLNKFHLHELTKKYTVSGFQIFGEGEDEQLVLMGSKEIESIPGGVLDIATAKIPLNPNSALYRFRDELKKTIDLVREEVIEYHMGKFTPIDTDPNQAEIDFETQGQDQELEDSRV